MDDEYATEADEIVAFDAEMAVGIEDEYYDAQNAQLSSIGNESTGPHPPHARMIQPQSHKEQAYAWVCDYHRAKTVARTITNARGSTRRGIGAASSFGTQALVHAFDWESIPTTEFDGWIYTHSGEAAPTPSHRIRW